jgi:carboxyl-terminal processing protease
MSKLFRSLAVTLCVLSAPVSAQVPATFNKEAYLKANTDALFNKYLESPYAETLEAEDKLAGLSLLWSEAKFNFANFDLVPLNLDSLYKAYIPRVLAAENTLAYYQVLKAFYAHLRDGHSGVGVPMELFERTAANPGIITEWIEGKVILTQTLPGVNLPKPVALGDEVLRINDVPVNEYIARQIAPYVSFSTPQDSLARILRFELFSGDINEPVAVTFRDKKGKTYTAALKRLAPQGLFQSGLPVGEFRVLENNIAYLALNTFNTDQVVPFFESHFAAISQTRGLIIDLRNNGGGNGQFGFEILGQLVDQPFMQSTFISRTYSPSGRAWGEPVKLEEIVYDWKPYKGRVYSKPVVLIVGPSTYSAAEDFTVAFRQANRGLIIGEPTGGSTGQPYFFRVPGGGYAWVCTKRDTFNNGTDFVGTGIVPDAEVKRSLPDLHKGKDNVIEYARRQLLEKK